MYGKIAAFGLLAVANARPAVTVPLSDVVHSTVASVASTAMSAATSTDAAIASYSTGAGIGATGTGTAGGAASTGAASYGAKFPLSNGFPNVQVPSSQLDTIEQQAHGTLPGPNGAPPTGLHDDTINSLAFIAFNELFEVSFFSTLVADISASKPGFTAGDIAPADRDTVLANLKVIVAQEELHALNALGAFNANTGKTIEPCTYKFPVKDFKSAIALAQTFTDVVLGTLPDIQTVAATAGDIGLIRPVGSVIGQEGEQNGFFRYFQGKVPSELPFLTASARNFAFNAILQNFIVTCPSQTLDFLEKPAGGIPLNETGVLTVLTKGLALEDVTAKFSFSTINPSQTKSYYESKKSSLGFITYVNQQNAPVSIKIMPDDIINISESAVTFKASFPGQSKFLNGLTIAALTRTGDHADVDSVAADTLFGPGLIEIN